MKKLLTLLPLVFLLSCSSSPAVSLQWSANPPEELVTSYKVYRVNGNKLVATVSAPTTTVNVDNFLSGGRTAFYVTAVNTAGEGPASSQVTVQTH